MLSINMRKVVFSIVGVFVISLITEIALIILAAAGSLGSAFSQSNWFLIGDAIVVNGLGIVIGLIWEKATSARYIAKVESSPAPSERAKKIYKAVLIIAILAGLFYVLSNLWAAYELFALHIVFTIPPATHTGFYIDLVRYIVLALVFVWLYAEPEPKDTSPILNIRQGLLLGIIYFFIMTIFTIFSLATFKVAAGTTSIQVPGSASPLQTVVNGQGQEVSLGKIYPSFRQFSVVLPSNFKMVGDGEGVIIAPASSSQDSATNNWPYSIVVEPGVMSPQDWAAGEGPTFQQAMNSSPNYGKNMSVVTSTTLFEIPTEEILSITGDEAVAYLSFEQNGIPFVLGIKETANISDPSLGELNKNLDSIWTSLTFGGVATGNNPIPQSAISSVPVQSQNGAASTPNTTQNNSNPFSTSPNFSVLMPNGGETWQLGQTQEVKWNAVSANKVTIYVHFSDGVSCLIGTRPASDGAYSFVLNPICSNTSRQIVPGQYTITIYGDNNLYADSAPFNVVAQ